MIAAKLGPWGDKYWVVCSEAMPVRFGRAHAFGSDIASFFE